MEGILEMAKLNLLLITILTIFSFLQKKKLDFLNLSKNRSKPIFVRRRE